MDLGIIFDHYRQPQETSFADSSPILVHANFIATNRSNIRMNPRIAVVDDDASVRKALKRLLETSSYEVEIFDTACEFVATLPHCIPECMIIDLQMSNMTGWGSCTVWRAPGSRSPLLSLRHLTNRVSEKGALPQERWPTVKAASKSRAHRRNH